MCDDSSIIQLAQKLFKLQDERVHTFNLFEEGYKFYMASAPNYNFAKFRQLVSEVTRDFQRISAHIIEIEKRFRFDGFDSVANAVALLQEEEELRLQLCAKLQIAKQDAIDNPHLPEKWNDVATLKEMFNKSIQNVNDSLENLRAQTDKLSSAC